MLQRRERDRATFPGRDPQVGVDDHLVARRGHGGRGGRRDAEHRLLLLREAGQLTEQYGDRFRARADQDD